MLELVGRWTQHFTKIDQKTRKIGQIYIWNPTADWQINEVNIVEEYSNRFPIPKLDL